MVGSSGRRAFTLIELLVAVAVVAVLLGVAIPALVSVRRSAMVTQSLSNARQLSAVMEAYASGSGSYPAFEAGVLYRTFGDEALISFPHWQTASHWSGIVYGLLPYPEHLSVYVSPGSARAGRRASDAYPSSYQYSNSFVGQPRLWDGSGVADESLKRAARPGQVRFPSDKALLWDIETGWRSEREFNDVFDLLVETAIAFGDGSARLLVPGEASEAEPNPFENAQRKMRLHNTADGVAGRDF